jgi:hypothetical protein
MGKPQTFRSDTDLPERIASGEGDTAVAGDHSEGSVGGRPGDVREYGVFHGDTPHKNVKVAEGPDKVNDGADLNPSIPADVDKDFRRIP